MQEYINILDILSKSYGTYELGKDAQIEFIHEKNQQIWNFHGEELAKLFKEEEDFALLCQQKQISWQENCIQASQS